jgi:hypothetical protein
MVAIIRRVVVLPAPFGPSSPRTRPARAANEIPSTARTSPRAGSRKVLLRFSTWIRVGLLPSVEYRREGVSA